MNNISILTNDKCFSCGSCALICPRNAIFFEENKEGFLFPIITNACINCGLCIKKCPSLSYFPKQCNIKKKVYMAFLKDSKKLMESTSGGLFTAIAEMVLKENGVVFGASYDNELNVFQRGVDSIDDLKFLKGSKYLESRTQQSFKIVKRYLTQKKIVFYSGTPCHIAGLKQFLGRDYDNLITADLICHGVPSQKLFHKYLKWLEEKENGKIIYYGFRDKDVGGWSCGGKIKIKTKTKTKTKTINPTYDPYYSSFLKYETYRESCYTCPYANKELYRPGDITLGDFFEIRELLPEIENQKGVSMCIINTKKGNEIFAKITQNIIFKEINLDDCIKLKEINLIRPSPRPSFRNIVYENIDTLSNKRYFKQFSYISILYHLKRLILKIIVKLFPKSIKEKIKIIIYTKEK